VLIGHEHSPESQHVDLLRADWLQNSELGRTVRELQFVQRELLYVVNYFLLAYLLT